MFICAYIHFPGTCAEALTHYATVFGSDDLVLTPVGDGPSDIAMPASGDAIMHGQVTITPGGVIMGSDFPQVDAHLPHSGITMHAMPSTLAEAERIFAALAEGGTVVSPLEANFFSPGFGFLKDRFGVHWMINTMPAEGAS